MSWVPGEKESAGSVELRRITAGKTDTELAALLGVDQSTVSRWRNGVRVPDANGRDLLEDKLGLPRGLWREPPAQEPGSPAPSDPEAA